MKLAVITSRATLARPRPPTKTSSASLGEGFWQIDKCSEYARNRIAYLDARFIQLNSNPVKAALAPHISTRVPSSTTCEGAIRK